MSDEQPQSLDLLENLIGRALDSGADAADAILVTGQSLSQAMRFGKPEHLERSESRDVGLRVFIGKRQAIVSSSDTAADALEELCQRAVSMAKVVPEDPYCGLAPEELLATEFPDVESADDWEPSADHLAEMATRAEQAALDVEGVTNSEGGQAGWGRNAIAVAASNGFSRSYANTGHSISASVLAGEGTGMERDYDYTSAVFASDLASPEEIGRNAGEKAVRRLNPRKAETVSVPILYDPRVSRSLVGHLSGAVNGTSIARGTSFLKDEMDNLVFPENVNIIDDPLRKRGLRSRPFDGEGVTTSKTHLVENGYLKTWILDLASARQLGLETTGHASRGISSPPSPSATRSALPARCATRCTPWGSASQTVPRRRCRSRAARPYRCGASIP